MLSKISKGIQKVNIANVSTHDRFAIKASAAGHNGFRDCSSDAPHLRYAKYHTLFINTDQV